MQSKNEKTIQDIELNSKNQKVFLLEKQAKEKAKYYFWVGNVSGYVWACTREYELHAKKGERFKYLGWTYDIGWPKKNEHWKTSTQAKRKRL